MGLTGLGQRVRADHLKRATSDLGKKSRLRILDAGGGSGVHSFYLARRLRDSYIVAIDKDGQAVANCDKVRKKLGFENLSFVSADLLTFRSRWQFDRILCFDVLEHVQDDKKVLENFNNWLMEGGRLILHTPSKHQKHYCQRAHEYRRQQLEPRGGDHVRHGYTPEEIASLLSEAGFSILRMTHTFGKSGTLAVDLDCLFWMQGHLLLRSLLFPFFSILTKMDLLLHKEMGNGILLVAEKKGPPAG